MENSIDSEYIDGIVKSAKMPFLGKFTLYELERACMGVIAGIWFEKC
ncbi:MAG: hypothetical protein Q7J27_05580 [Syntrophales bacterium]|nr:hypothetical protein [Syntrophales bacterium]